MKLYLLWPAVIILSAALMAESKDCLNPGLITTDSRIINSQFEAAQKGQNPTYWYLFYGQAGHSYSVEFVPNDNENSNDSIHFTNLTIWGPNDVPGLQQNGCRGASTLPVVATSRYTPAVARDIYGSGQRLSLIQSVSGWNIMAITNTGGKADYSYRVIDTTLFNARWSTWAGYDSQWGFTNTSDMTISGTLSVYDGANRLLASASVTIPPGAQTFRTSGSTDLNLPRNSSGYAIFTYNGSPQAVIGDAYMLNGPATVVVYAKFETRNSQ
jgi:hypothetical protein